LHQNIFRPDEYLANKTRDARGNTHRWSRKMVVKTLRHEGQLKSLNNVYVNDSMSILISIGLGPTVLALSSVRIPVAPVPQQC